LLKINLLNVAGGFILLSNFIIPIKILVFNGVYDIFLIGKKKLNEFNILE